jgi:hypothetical protein
MKGRLKRDLQWCGNVGGKFKRKRKRGKLKRDFPVIFWLSLHL